jgi:virginiamycin B lyase
MRAAIRLALLALFLSTTSAKADIHRTDFPLPSGTRPHDVAPASDGGVWYTGQRKGVLGRLDPRTGKVEEIPLGRGSAPHGVIIGPDGAPWVNDGGLNAIVRVDPGTHAIQTFPLPADRRAEDLNTATFDRNGTLWFTGQAGIYGRLAPRSGEMRVWDAPKGPGPYGITTTRDGGVYFASLAGSYIARIDTQTGAATVLEPPTPDQGARRVWADSRGGVWVSEWNGGQIARFDPASGRWQSWRVPGDSPRPYAIYVDEHDVVWLSDFGANAILSFEPTSGRFTISESPRPSANVRQLAGRPGEVWAPESGTDHLVRITTRTAE